AERPPAVSPTSATLADTTRATRPLCPADGLWHECSVLERLERAGLAPRRDSSSVAEKGLTRRGMLVRLGRAELSIFLYPDEPSRVTDEKALDRSDLVDADKPMGIR